MDQINYLRNLTQPFFQVISNPPYPLVFGTGLMAFAVSIVNDAKLQERARFLYKSLSLTAGAMALWALSQNHQDIKASFALLAISLVELCKKGKENSRLREELNALKDSQKDHAEYFTILVKKDDKLREIKLKKKNYTIPGNLLNEKLQNINLDEINRKIKIKDFQKFLDVCWGKKYLHSENLWGLLCIAEFLNLEKRTLKKLQYNLREDFFSILIKNFKGKDLPKIKQRLLTKISEDYFQNLYEKNLNAHAFFNNNISKIKKINPSFCFRLSFDYREQINLIRSMRGLKYCDFSNVRYLNYNLLNTAFQLKNLKIMKLLVGKGELALLEKVISQKPLEKLYLLYKDDIYIQENFTSSMATLTKLSQHVKQLHCKLSFNTYGHYLPENFSIYDYLDKIKKIQLSGLSFDFPLIFTDEDLKKTLDLPNEMTSLKTLTVRIPRGCNTKNVKEQLAVYERENKKCKIKIIGE